MPVQSVFRTVPARRLYSGLIKAGVFRCTIYRFSSVGPETADDLLRCLLCTPEILTPESAILECTECRSLTIGRPACIGKFTKSARATAGGTTKKKRECRSQSVSVGIPLNILLRPRLCLMGSMRCFSLDSFEKNRSSL